MINDTSGRTEMMFQEEPGKGVALGDDVVKAAEGITAMIFETAN